MRSIFARLSAFFGPAAGSLRGHIRLDELYRSIVAGLGGATLIGVLIAVVSSIDANAGAIFDADTAAAATFACGLILDLLRRASHGATPAAASPFVAPCDKLSPGSATGPDLRVIEPGPPR